MLEVKNIETFYGPIRALHGVSFSIREGSITTILGNNGAGKTTTLKTIMGLLDDQPEKGKVIFRSRDITHWNTPRIVREGISYVPEGRAVFDELTVLENLRAGAYTRTNKREILQDLERMFQWFPVLRDRQKQQANNRCSPSPGR